MRTLVHSPYFEQQARVLNYDIQRLDEVLHGVKWSISRMPEGWPLVDATTLRVAITEPAGDIPGLLIYFTIDDEATCTLRALAQADDPEDDI